MKFKLLSIFIFVFLAGNVYAKENDKVALHKCIDGDTASFLLNDEIIKVRFLAIDTPETVHPNKKTTQEGINASEFTCNKLKEAKDILLEYDPNSQLTDKYNRILAWIWADNDLLQNELIKNGLAEVKYLYGNYLYTDLLYSSQKDAINDKKGIWKTKNYYIVIFDDGKETKIVDIPEQNKVDFFIPTQKKHRFKGWYLNEEAFDFNTPITKNIKLTAKYNNVNDLIYILSLMLLLLLAYKLKNTPLKKYLRKKLNKII
ncbi:MAG: thermonuclease family protein [Bacilli bacterium]|nr:thermonuclease family protein [Bacilli bacterium]